MNPFNVVQHAQNEISNADKSLALHDQIKKIISADSIVLFMKGNADFPQCGFSANTVQILRSLGATFKTFNILSDQDIRQGLKEYSNWPTFPQLYIKGELIGGNDIVTQLYQSGELKNIIQK
jgi:monothiol glutaredoxin